MRPACDNLYDLVLNRRHSVGIATWRCACFRKNAALTRKTHSAARMENTLHAASEVNDPWRGRAISYQAHERPPHIRTFLPTQESNMKQRIDVCQFSHFPPVYFDASKSVLNSVVCYTFNDDGVSLVRWIITCTHHTLRPKE